MKRLLKISFDVALLSFVPILSWFCLSLILDKNLINVFTLTYPFQFILYIIKSVFSTGANISKEKDKNPDAVMSGIVIGSVVAFLIFGIVILNIDNYIVYMNMDINIYRNFALYSIIQLYIQLIFNFILNKLYYEDKNTLANKYSLLFNLLNFMVLIGSSFFIKDQIKIIIITLVSISLFTMYVAFKSFDHFKLKLDILKCIKYDSVDLFNNIMFFIIFFFGLSNALHYGEKYLLALNFVALITDTQWDTFDAIATVAQIDISRNKFNYKYHIHNAYKLLLILLSTTIFMFLALYHFYDLNFKLTMIYFAFELVNFVIYPIYRIKTCYLQLEYSALKTTTNKIVSSILRMFVSLLNTPFCTGLGQVSSSLYQFFTINYIFKKNYQVTKTGKIIKLNK